MRRLGLGMLGAGVLALALGTPSAGRADDTMPHFRSDPQPAPVPSFAFQAPDGKPLNLHAFAGKVVLVNLWATWCPPCVHEMPALDRLQAALGGQDFQVVDISIDRGGAPVVNAFFAGHGLTHLKPYLDPSGDAVSALHLRGVPTSILIDRNGKELGRLEGGAPWDGPAARALIEQAEQSATAAVDRAAY